MTSDITIKFADDEQAATFYKWFMLYGFDMLCESDFVHDELATEYFYKGITLTESNNIIEIT